MIDVLLTPAVFIGFSAGALVAVAFHWLAPAGVATAEAGAWLVGLGCLAGVVWSLVFGQYKAR